MSDKKQIHFRGKVVDMATEMVRLPNGHELEMDVVLHPGGAAAVALDDKQQVCLLRQYRCVFDQWLWELPAGKIDHQEPPFDTVRRELQEEAGITAGLWDELGYVISSPGVFTERVYLYLARQLHFGSAAKEDHEVFEVHWLPLEEALAWCDQGEIVDAKTIAGLYRAACHVKTESVSE
jgi:8-oxo-dGTP pyrophosphatase MutT (NUDIX family)